MSRYLARGTQLLLGDGADPEVYTPIAQAITHEGPSMTSTNVEFDDHDVAAGWAEKRKVKLDAGQHTFRLHFDPDAATHIALLQEFATIGAPKNWRLKFPVPTSVNDRWGFTAEVSSVGPISAASDGKLEASVTLDITGVVNFAAGTAP